jgi:RNA polymerase sigma-70 factor (ECF subfamily)
MPTLAETFWGALGTSRADDALEARLERMLATAEAAWPGITLDPGDFCAHIARSVEQLDDVSSLEALHVGDLLLAYACAKGDPRALRIFDEHILSSVGRHVAAVDSTAQFAEEVRQNVREELLLAREGGPPKIAAYSGRGSLSGWVRVVAVRRALNLKRGGPGAAALVGEEAVAELPSGEPDPELDFLKAQYRHEFRDAFAAALSQLEREQRTALRLHHLDGLTLDEVAAICGVSRATIARWLADARKEILRSTNRLLAQRLKLGTSSTASLYRLVESQLDLSIHKYLASSRDDDR